MKAIYKLNDKLKYTTQVNNRNVVAAICAQEFKSLLKYTKNYSDLKFIELLIEQCMRQVHSDVTMKLYDINEIFFDYKMYAFKLKESKDNQCKNCIPADESITLKKLAPETIDFIEEFGGCNAPKPVQPDLTVTWYNERTGEYSTSLNINAIGGDTYIWQGSYIWHESSAYSNPTSFASNVFTVLTKPGVESPTITKTVTTNLSFYITLKGVYADGEYENKESSSIKFSYKYYYGILNGDLKSITSNNHNVVLSNVSTLENEYFVFKYPADLPKLNSIIMNNTTEVLAAFNYSEELGYYEESGKSTIMRVYTSANPGAFTNTKLNFK